MRKNVFLFINSLTLAFLSSCGEHPCAPTELTYSLIGFTDAESDTIILRRFTKNTSQLKDSFFFHEANPLRFSRKNDTLTMAAISSTALLESSYDYQLYFPQPNRLYTITNIVEEQLYGKNNSIFNTKKPMCGNRISSCSLNGQVINLNTWRGPLYLHR
jgi:hypothetical protein